MLPISQSVNQFMMEIIMQIIFYVNLEKLDFTTYYIFNLVLCFLRYALRCCIITSLNSCLCLSVNESKKRFCSLAID